MRKNCRGAGMNVFVLKLLPCKRRHDLGINSEAVESLIIEISNKKCKKIISNTICKPANGDMKTCGNYFEKMFAKNDKKNKYIVLASNFNLNMLDFENDKKVQNFINLMFRRSKPTQAAANTATSIDHIIINVIIDTNFKTGIFKSFLKEKHFGCFCYHASLSDR